MYAEEDKRDDIINEYYFRSRKNISNNKCKSENTKLLYKLRNASIESNKKDDKDKNNKIMESVFENVNFDDETTLDVDVDVEN